MKIRSSLGALDILIHLIIWGVITILTLGIGMFFYAYSFSKLIINNSKLIDDKGVAREMVCDTGMFENIGHMILWIIISIFTFGLAYWFYFYKVWTYSLNNTIIK